MPCDICHPQVIETLLVADVGLDSRTAGAQAVYTYRVAPESKVLPGEAYFVPLGPRRAIGFVLFVRSVKPEELGFSVGLLKGMGAKIEGLEMPAELLELVHEVARQTLSPVAVARCKSGSPPGCCLGCWIEQRVFA